jgi:hypothetical protein
MNELHGIDILDNLLFNLSINRLTSCYSTISLQNKLVEQVVEQVVKHGVVFKFLGLLVYYWLMTN